mmetsp:Transcript_2785/g.4965  ORF Transcript_2785/g.4965 Transcript_2785/m.4965 type:complete len:310 (+) Transcript_2785:203-1132(+)
MKKVSVVSWHGGRVNVSRLASHHECRCCERKDGHHGTAEGGARQTDGGGGGGLWVGRGGGAVLLGARRHKRLHLRRDLAHPALLLGVVVRVHLHRGGLQVLHHTLLRHVQPQCAGRGAGLQLVQVHRDFVVFVVDPFDGAAAAALHRRHALRGGDVPAEGGHLGDDHASAGARHARDAHLLRHHRHVVLAPRHRAAGHLEGFGWGGGFGVPDSVDAHHRHPAALRGHGDGGVHGQLDALQDVAVGGVDGEDGGGGLAQAAAGGAVGVGHGDGHDGGVGGDEGGEAGQPLQRHRGVLCGAPAAVGGAFGE